VKRFTVIENLGALAGRVISSVVTPAIAGRRTRAPPRPQARPAPCSRNDEIQDLAPTSVNSLCQSVSWEIAHSLNWARLSLTGSRRKRGGLADRGPSGPRPAPGEARGAIARSGGGRWRGPREDRSVTRRGWAGLGCNLPSCLQRCPGGASKVWAASRDKVERTEATILAFRSGPREADHIRWPFRRTDDAGLRTVQARAIFCNMARPKPRRRRRSSRSARVLLSGVSLPGRLR